MSRLKWEREGEGTRVVSRLAWWGLGASALLGVAVLPSVAHRVSEVDRSEVSPTSLAYLRLALERDPGDTRLRYELVRALTTAGALGEARLVLEEGARQPLGMAAVELDYAAWAAVSPGEEALRSQALRRLERSIEVTAGDINQTDTGVLRELSEVCLRASLGELRASLLSSVAKRSASPSDVSAADAALRAVGRPGNAAELWAELASALGPVTGEAYALRALERAREANRPAQALDLFARLEARGGASQAVMAAGFELATGVDDESALRIGKRLMGAGDRRPTVRRRVAALEQWFARDAKRGSARAAGSGSNRTPSSGATQADRVLAQARLFEEQGQSAQATAVLDQALSAGGNRERRLWHAKLNLQLRSGAKGAALTTLAQMSESVPLDPSLSTLRAELLVSDGQLASALRVLQQAAAAGDLAAQRRILDLAWELGDMAAARTSLASIAPQSAATLADFERLWLLEMEQKRYRSATDWALQAHRRFGAQAMAVHALEASLASGDPARVLVTLDRAVQQDPHFADSVQAVQYRALAEQRRAYLAARTGHKARAWAASNAAEQVLARALRRWPEFKSNLDPVLDAQREQVFGLALQFQDRKKVAELLPTQAKSLTVRQRVHALHLIGDDRGAAETALAETGELDAPANERDALARDAEWITSALPRQVRAKAGIEQTPGLEQVSVGASARHAWSAERRLTLDAGLSELRPDLPGRRAQGQLQLGAELAFGGTALTVGATSTSSEQLQPFLRVRQHVIDTARLRLQAALAFNERAQETAALRLASSRDQGTLSFDAALGHGYYASGAASAALYRETDRTLLGQGLELTGGLGRAFPLTSEDTAAVRIASYVASRSRQFEAEGIVPESVAFFGLGATLARGDVERAPVLGRHVSYLLDASGGWLALQQQVGWSVQGGIGISVFGADMASISVRSSNVAGTAPGQGSHGIEVGYTASTW